MNYKFRYYKELATGDGYNYPIDISYGTIHLGTVVHIPGAYVIKQVDTPKGKIGITQSPHNHFESIQQVAEILHRTWKSYRQAEPPEEPLGEPVIA